MVHNLKDNAPVIEPCLNSSYHEASVPEEMVCMTDPEENIEYSSDEGDIESNAFDRLRDDSESRHTIPYSHGPQVSRQTIWRGKRKQDDLQNEAKRHKPMTSYFKPINVAGEQDLLGKELGNQAQDTDNHTDSADRMETLSQAVLDLKRLLRSAEFAKLPKQTQTRHEAVLDFMNRQVAHLRREHPQKRVRVRLSMDTSDGYGKSAWFAKSVRCWEDKWISSRNIPGGRQGMTSIRSWLADEGLLLFVRSWVDQNAGKITAHNLASAVTDYMQSNTAGEVMEELLRDAQEEEEGGEETEASISEPPSEDKQRLAIRVRTGRNWLNSLGLSYSRIGKGLYKDGHEREDVTSYRQKVFLPKFFELREQEDLVFITQDESSFHATDAISHTWMKPGEPPIRPKGRGKSIMVSEFLTDKGRLCSTDTEGQKHYATEFLETGSGIWWTGEMLVQQVKKALSVFRSAFPSQRAVWLFDNATGHSIYAPDALVASRMNLNPGGKQPHMKDGWYDSNGERRIQKMSYEKDHDLFPGQPKGLKRVLVE